MLYLTTALFVASVLLPASSFAVITKLVIEKREPFAGGHEFQGFPDIPGGALNRPTQ